MRTSVFILILFLFTSSVFSANLHKQDAETITGDVELFVQQFRKNNHVYFVEKMPARLFKVLNIDRKTILDLTEKSMQEIIDKGGKIRNYKYTLLNQRFTCKDTDIVFIRLLATIEMQDTVIGSDGFLVASRDTGDNSWYYIDGTFIHKNRKLFDQIYNCHGVEIVFPRVAHHIRNPEKLKSEEHQRKEELERKRREELEQQRRQELERQR